MNFEKVAPYLQDPLVLVGFVLFLFFGLGRVLLKSGIIPPLPEGLAYNILRLLLTYGFILALAVVGSGGVLKYRELSEKEQRSSVNLLQQELHGNFEVISELKQNIETILEHAIVVHNSLRHPGIKISATLFPSENADPQADVPASLDYARQQIELARTTGLLDDQNAKSQFIEVGRAIVGTVDRTMPTIEMLADANGKRYPISSDVWKAHLPILRKISVIDVTQLQQLYQEMERLRTNYTVSLNYAVEYLKLIRDYFASSEATYYTPERLAAVLAAERIFLTTINDYAKIVVKKLELIIEMRRGLMDLENTLAVD